MANKNHTFNFKDREIQFLIHSINNQEKKASRKTGGYYLITKKKTE